MAILDTIAGRKKKKKVQKLTDLKLEILVPQTTTTTKHQSSYQETLNNTKPQSNI